MVAAEPAKTTPFRERFAKGTHKKFAIPVRSVIWREIVVRRNMALTKNPADQLEVPGPSHISKIMSSASIGSSYCSRSLHRPRAPPVNPPSITGSAPVMSRGLGANETVAVAFAVRAPSFIRDKVREPVHYQGMSGGVPWR
jgi:hypothetical protein